MEKLERYSATELGNLVNRRELAPTEVIDYFASRIEEYNPRLNAVNYVRLDEARARAAELEARLAKGEKAGAFAGVPIGFKNFLPSKKGWIHSHGGVKALTKTDPIDSEFCRGLESAGAIGLCKTNAPAFGFSGTCDNDEYGATSNPFDTSKNSGGSSGGSAASVAAGLLSIAEGGDGGGSIRIPASWCGVFGYKSSIGTVPSVCRPDAFTATHPFCTNGCLTRTVEDSAAALNYMARYDPRDPYSLPRRVNDFTAAKNMSMKGVRIALTPDFDLYPRNDEICETVKKAAMRFTEAGAVVDYVNFKFPHTLMEYADFWCESISVDTAIELEQYKAEGIDISGQVPDEFIKWNEKVSRNTNWDYYRYNLLRSEITDAFEDVFEKYDLIVSPTLCCMPVENNPNGMTYGPREMGGMELNPVIGFCETFLVNFLGNPACSIPAGLSKAGLPIGMQIIGKRFCDMDVLSAAYTFEQLQPWRQIYERF